MIVFVAPYGGMVVPNSSFLAGAKKIRFLLRALTFIDPVIVLLNSGHQCSARTPMSFRDVDVGDGVIVPMVTPDTYFHLGVGRLINLAQVGKICDVVVARYGRPRVVWCYNGYAFESQAGRVFKRKYGARVVLEFEDWHFARNRGLNPKPLLDWFFWRLAVRGCDFGYAVNDLLAEKMRMHGVPTDWLPGVVENEICALPYSRPPFRDGKPVTAGYFGGLTRDKGGAFVLQLLDFLRVLGSPVVFLVTGKGELEDEFRRYAVRYPEQLRFFGTVSDSEVVKLIGQVDVIVNAHEQNDGVFPFKVMEALASGRLLMSGRLGVSKRESNRWLFEAIEFLSLDVRAFADALSAAAMIYKNRKAAINRAFLIVSEEFGPAGVHRKLTRSLMG